MNDFNYYIDFTKSNIVPMTNEKLVWIPSQGCTIWK